MRNYKITVQYEGTRYQGWQRQESSENTIQGKLEAVLSKMCGAPVEVQGSGRTDAGVHSLGQTANFHIDTDRTVEQIMEYMNAYLPEDIAVVGIGEVPERFHSRLNAKGKTYRYRVLNSDVPHIFERRYVYPFPRPLDADAMQEAARSLCGTHDFKAFTSAKRGRKSTVRTVEDISVERRGDEVWFTFSGNGFLYHMVRIITGTLLEVGTHERKAEDMERILHSGDRGNAGPLVPGKGLILMEVRYS